MKNTNYKRCKDFGIRLCEFCKSPDNKYCYVDDFRAYISKWGIDTMMNYHYTSWKNRYEVIYMVKAVEEYYPEQMSRMNVWLLMGSK